MSITLALSNKANKLHQIKNILPVLLLVGDILGLVLSLTLVSWLRLGEKFDSFDPVVYGFILLVLIGLYLANTYHPDTQIAGLRAPSRIFISNVIVGGITAALIYLTGTWGQNPLFGRGVLLSSLGIFTIWAVISRMWTLKWVRSHAQQSRWLMLGTGEKAIHFGQTFLKLDLFGRLVVLAEGEQPPKHLAQSRIDCPGSLSDLPKWSQQPWSGVVVATQMDLPDTQVRQLMQMRLQGIPVYTLPDVCETLWYKLPSSLLQDSWLAFGGGFNLASGSFNLKLKRFADKILAWLLPKKGRGQRAEGRRKEGKL
ncbi:hypothetical protein [Scytonema sp. PCC 10023]|uniref:hypothetical protein n=1 Tax=Scytonema sp. PCC 10023 TaxID=1680591 RepID=UPI0039C5AD6E